MAVPDSVLDSCEATLGEMQNRMAKTRKVGALIGGTVTVIGLIWTAWALLNKPKPPPPEAPTSPKTS